MDRRFGSRCGRCRPLRPAPVRSALFSLFYTHTRESEEESDARNGEGVALSASSAFHSPDSISNLPCHSFERTPSLASLPASASIPTFT